MQAGTVALGPAAPQKRGCGCVYGKSKDGPYK